MLKKHSFTSCTAHFKGSYTGEYHDLSVHFIWSYKSEKFNEYNTGNQSFNFDRDKTKAVIKTNPLELVNITSIENRKVQTIKYYKRLID